MQARHILHRILLVAKHYQDALESLTREIATGRYALRDMTMSTLFSSPADYRHFLDAARANALDFSPYDTSVEKIERRWAELNFDARRAGLLAQLPPGEFERRLLEEVAFQARAYCNSVRVIREASRKMTAEEYEEFQQGDELSDLETFTLRDTVELLLSLLPATEEKQSLQEAIAAADELLQSEGVQFFGPLLHMGSIQQMRAARFEPRERWWWYLDELEPANGQPSAPAT
jgi:hypothetical protein